jgi:gamma-glutamyltranspeptidase/glutathione hydrolase
VSELFRFEAAARTLRLVAETRGEDYYAARLAARAVERHAREHGAAMTAADFAAYRPEWVRRSA